MNKLGVHVSAGPRNGFGQFLATCFNAGRPVPVVFAVDQDIMPDLQRYSPTTIGVYRHQPAGTNGNPQGFLTGDPIGLAHAWMNQIMVNWRLNPGFNYYAPINEPGFGTAAEGMWLNTFMLECETIAEENGFKLALYAFSAGNPSDDGGLTLEQRWSLLSLSMQHAKANGHVLLLHEYGLGPQSGNPSGLLETSAPFLALRYRRTYAALKTFGGDVPIIVSEASADNGFTGNAGRWLPDAEWYDQQLAQDDYVIGCCLYQVGGPENWASQFNAVAAYITTHADPTPTPTTEIRIVTNVAEEVIDIRQFLYARGYHFSETVLP